MVAVLWLTAKVAVAQVPSPRAHHALFYDVARERVLLTGGVTTSGRQITLLNDLWSFDGARWTAYDTSGERLSATRVAVDGRRRVLSFGGWRDSAVGDLRLLEGNRWRVLGVHPSIVAADAGVVFDGARDRLVAFGASAKDPSTFEWLRRDVRGPAGRMMAGHAYDAKRGLVLVFGGTDGTSDRNDLWAWDGAAWKLLADSGPAPRVMGHLAYDRKRDRLVMFGGRRGYADLGDTWEWDGARWTRILP